MAEPVIPPINPTTPDPTQVFSGTNVAQTMTAPLPAPDYSDPLKLRDYFYKSPEIEAERTALSDLNKQLATLRTNTRNQQNFIEDRTVPMDIIRGEQASQLRLSSAQEQALSEQQQVRQANLSTFLADADQRFNLAYQQRSQIQDLISQTGGKAGISYADSFETATAKAQKYIDKKNKEAKKEEEKDALKDMYFQLTGKVAKKGLSSNELKKAVSKAGASQKAIEAELQQIQLAQAKKNLAGSGGSTAGSILSSAGAKLTRGEGGFTDGNEYQRQKDAAVATGKLTPEQFDAQYSYLLSPSDQQKFGTIQMTAAEKAAQLEATAAKEKQISQAKASIPELEKKLSLINSVTGRGVGAGLTGWIESATPDFTGSKANNLTRIEALIGKETLDTLLALKAQGGTLGAVSEKELAILQASGSRIGAARTQDSDGNVRYRMTESEFNKEIANMKAATERVLEAARSTIGEGSTSVGEIVEKNGIKYRKVNGGWEQL